MKLVVKPIRATIKIYTDLQTMPTVIRLVIPKIVSL